MNKVFKLTDVVGVSDKSIEDAVKAALARAEKTVHNMGWFEVKEIRGQIKDGKASEFQVSLRIGFRLD